MKINDKPEGGYDPEVRAVVCFLQEGVQQGVHIQFDSEPKNKPGWNRLNNSVLKFKIKFQQEIQNHEKL